jgi:hypothetical protein
MHRKGMLEWKILAAIFAVLIVLSSALVSNTGIKDFFLNATGNLGDWVHGSPFGSLFTTPQKKVNQVAIKLMADNMTFEMETPINITAGKTSISNFKGSVNFNFRKNSSTFQPADSDLRFGTELSGTVMKDVKIQKLVLTGIDFTVIGEKTNITASNDNIEIYDFSGDITVEDRVLLTGNVSRVKDEQWSIG